MPESGIAAATLLVVKEILKTISLQKKGSKTSAPAGRLTFWDDGMLKELKLIASGEGDLDKIKRLREKFEDSEACVNRAINRLISIRNELGATRLSKQIDAVVNSTEFGKGQIRLNIRELLGVRNK